MNAYERLTNRIRGVAVDRPPNLSILMQFAANYADVSYRDFCLSPGSMVAANLLCQRDFQIDAVTVMSDPYGEAHDYGMHIEYPENSNPRAEKLFWPEAGAPPSAEDIPLREAGETTRMKARVETIARYAQAVKGECPIVGWVEGPVAAYCVLRGAGPAMMDFADEAEFLTPVLDALCRQAIAYATAQVAAGADIIGIGDAACSMLGPALYHTYGKPYERRIAEALHAQGALVKLHICGNITPLLAGIAEVRPDILDVDWMVDLARAGELLPGIALSGNIDPVGVLLRGTAGDVEKAVETVLQAGNSRTIVSSGCEVPPGTPAENLRAISKVIQRHGR